MKRTWLKEKRENLKFTQKEVAEQIGLATSTYAMYEQGRRTPDVITSAKIGSVLKFDWQLFFEKELHDMCKKVC